MCVLAQTERDVSDDLEKGFLGSEEYALRNRGPKCLRERMNGLDRVEGVHKKQGDDVGPSRKRVQAVPLVQVECT